MRKLLAFAALSVAAILVVSTGAFAADLPLHPAIFDVSMAMAAIPSMRGIRSVRADAVRADAGEAARIFADLQKTVHDFKQERDEELKEIKAGLADVVKTEKVDRINESITQLSKDLDATNKAIAAMRVGGAGSDTDPDKAEHATAFNRWFRRGVDNGLSDLEVKAKLTTQSDPDGGYLVPEETEAGIDRVLGKVSVIRSLARTINISTDNYKKLVNMGGATSGWVGETDARPETATPTLREIAINTGEIYAQPGATQKSLDDSSIDVTAWLAEEVSIEFAEQEGAAFANGDGVNKPRGFLTYDKVANSSYVWGKLGYVVSGAASDFDADDPADAFIDLYYALKAGHRQGATFLASDAIMPAIRKFKDGQGNYLWAPPTAAEAPGTILGKPLATDDNMPAVGAGTFPIAFGNFNRAYLIADRIGIRVLRDPYTNKPNVLFYTTKRVGGGLVNFEALKFLKIGTS